MGFDKFKNFWNVDIKDGVKGKAVVQATSMPPDSSSSHNVSLWLDVYVDGWEPYRTQHHCMVRRDKHPQPGETLPVVVRPTTGSGSTSSGTRSRPSTRSCARVRQSPRPASHR